MRNENTSAGKAKWLPLGYVAAFIFLTVGIGAVGSLYLKNQFAKSRQAAENELGAIGNLKTNQISKWYSDQFEHVNYFFNSPLIPDTMMNLENNPSDLESKIIIKGCLSSIRQNFHYKRVLLFDYRQQLLFSFPEEINWVEPTSKKFIADTLDTGKIMVSDIHEGKIGMDTILDIFIPLSSIKTGSDPSKKNIGVLMLEINPHDFLFPLIQSWPTPSKSAETLLIRKEGDEVVYLNELRHRKDTSLKLRFPIDEKANLPAAMAVLGEKGIVEGLDYRDIPVLADIGPVPGTPWFMVAKIDKNEIYSHLKKEAVLTLVLILMFILATAMGAWVLWKKRDIEILRKSHEELEKRVEERTAELTVVNKELEAFSYSVSHDLKSPLRSVDGFAKMLEEDYSSKLDEEGRRLLKVIRDSAKDMGQLISDLLEFSRLSRKDLRRTNINMNELVREVYAQLENDLRGRTVNLDAGSLPEIYGDPAMIKEVIVNLLSNSFKFTRPKKVAVVNIEAKEEDGEIVFTIRDNGVGFDMSYKDKLFCVFQRLHSASEFEGTGIGLALVQRIIHRHGGRVWAESELEKGATFYFSLPKKI